MPIQKMQDWLELERKLGSPEPDRIVLASTTKEGVPHSRIVAIRKMNTRGILFFTQNGTRKVAELRQNSQASMTLWLPLQQREVMLDGYVEELALVENQTYWKQMPRERQLRFRTYAPQSGQPIASLNELDNKLNELTEKLENQDVEMSEFYCGFYFIPQEFRFYTLGSDVFSEVIRHTKDQDDWQIQQLSP